MGRVANMPSANGAGRNAWHAKDGGIFPWAEDAQQIALLPHGEIPTRPKLVADVADQAGPLRDQIALADGLQEQVAFFDPEWTVIAVNQTWSKASWPDSVCNLAAGDDYLRFCNARASVGDKCSAAIVDALRHFDAGDETPFEQLDVSDRAATGRIYRMRLSVIGNAPSRLVMLARYDVTELLKLRRQRSQLGGRLMRAQEDERRRVARDLHDSTSQELVALQLCLMRLRASKGGPASATFADIDAAVGRVQREIRLLSYLCHPPALAETGLATALQTMSEGFAKRTGLRLNLFLDYADIQVTDTEATAYRIAQEALANVHRHSQAHEVDVQLMATTRRLHLLIRDDGIGFDGSATGGGVGLAAMRERVDELGGRLTFHSVGRGTTIVANLPFGATGPA